jgi:hypothetical protein
VLVEIRDISRAANNQSKSKSTTVASFPQSKITSARDSKLTLILGASSYSSSTHLSRPLPSSPFLLFRSSAHSRQHQDLVLSSCEGWRRELSHRTPHPVFLGGISFLHLAFSRVICSAAGNQRDPISLPSCQGPFLLCLTVSLIPSHPISSHLISGHSIALLAIEESRYSASSTLRESAADNSRAISSFPSSLTLKPSLPSTHSHEPSIAFPFEQCDDLQRRCQAHQSPE